MTKVNKGFYTLEYCDDCGELLVFSGWDYRGEDILIEQYECPVCVRYSNACSHLDAGYRRRGWKRVLRFVSPHFWRYHCQHLWHSMGLVTGRLIRNGGK